MIAAAGALAATAPAATTPSGGTYTTKLSGTPIALLNATWKVQFKPDGHYVIYRNGTIVVTGVARVVPHFGGVGQYLTGFFDGSGSAACLGKGSEGYYTWTIKKAAGHVYLQFKPEKDLCPGRKAVLSTHPLLKIK